MTNRERAELWVADRSSKGFYSPTTTDDLTTLLDEVRIGALHEAAEAVGVIPRECDCNVCHRLRPLLAAAHVVAKEAPPLRPREV